MEMRSAPDWRITCSVDTKMFSIVCSERLLLRRRRGTAGLLGRSAGASVATATPLVFFAFRADGAAVTAGAGRLAGAARRAAGFAAAAVLVFVRFIVDPPMKS